LQQFKVTSGNSKRRDDMTIKDLTAEELEWAKQNSDIVRAAMAAAPKNATTEEYPSEGIDKAAMLLTRSITKKLAKINAKETELEESIARYREIAASESADSREIGEGWLADNLPVAEKAGRKFAFHKAALEAKLVRLRDDPEGCFLPLGTIVRFARVQPYEDSLELTDRRKDYPIAGSVGVVTRLNYRDECFIGVSMRRKFKTGWNDTYHPNYENTPTYIVDPEMLEVLGYATLPDGSEHHGYDFIETHEREREGDDAEMVLEADGFFWRLHDFGGTQGIECLQAYDDISKMSWLRGAIEQFRTPPATTTPVLK
jgi:hypothetical protein